MNCEFRYLYLLHLLMCDSRWTADLWHCHVSGLVLSTDSLSTHFGFSNRHCACNPIKTTNNKTTKQKQKTNLSLYDWTWCGQEHLHQFFSKWFAGLGQLPAGCHSYDVTCSTLLPVMLCASMSVWIFVCKAPGACPYDQDTAPYKFTVINNFK